MAAFADNITQKTRKLPTVLLARCCLRKSYWAARWSTISCRHLATAVLDATGNVHCENVARAVSSSRICFPALKEISHTIGRINEISTKIASAVEEQAAATREVTSNISGTNQAVGEANRAAGDVLTSSEGLAKNASELEMQVEAFLTKVRAM